MRILYLTHRIPFPPNKGEKIRSFNIFKFINEKNEVHLGTLIDDPKDEKYLSHLSDLAKSVSYDFINPKAKKAISALQLLNKGSISTFYFYSRKLHRLIDSLMEIMQFDVIFCSSSPMAEYVFKSKIPVHPNKNLLYVMDLIDVDSQKWFSYAERSFGWKRWIYKREAQYLALYEKRIAEHFDRILLVSEKEKMKFLKIVSTNKATTVCNGVDLKYFSSNFKGKLRKDGPVITFTGAMDYWPNIDGVQWFARKVFPHIRDRIPDSTFYIVGSKPTKEVKQLTLYDGIKVTGYVDDIRHYLAMADVCVAPLRIAQGVQNKVLEALSMGKAVVCTPQAREGLKALTGEEIVVANSENEFALSVIKLIQDKNARDRLARRARRHVEENYSWAKNLSVLNDILDKTNVGN
jgi:sugar transferase (PEP-CTERM/EpsH1 system associated)